MKKAKLRYSVPDILRGFALVNMIMYHALWDAVNIFGANIPFYGGKSADVWQMCICMTFIVLSGFCIRLGGSKKLRRGITILLSGAVVSAVTIAVMPEADAVFFGVLTLIGSCMLIVMLTEKSLSKIPPFVGTAVCVLAFIITGKVPDGALSLFGHEIIKIPDLLYANLLTAYIGFPPDSFASSDYFPLVPWTFAYIAGYFLYGVFTKKGLTKYLSAVKNRPFQWLGRHSLSIYLLHQPVIYAIMYIWFEIK